MMGLRVGIFKLANRLCLMSGLPRMIEAFWQFGGGALRLPVIYFHGVSRDQRGWFEGVIAEIASTHRFIRLDELAGLADDDESKVLLTFDDALESLVDNALPTLEKYRCPATIFVPTAWVGREAQWTEEVMEMGERVMSWKTIIELDSPTLRFESHTMTHPKLTRISPPEQILGEFCSSKAMLEDRLGRPVEYLCYPFGIYDRRAVYAARKAGYRGAFSSVHSVWQPHQAPYELRRILCRPQIDTRMVRNMLVGAQEWNGIYHVIMRSARSVTRL